MVNYELKGRNVSRGTNEYLRFMKCRWFKNYIKVPAVAKVKMNAKTKYEKADNVPRETYQLN
jgi:hypothetical protein